MLAQSLSSVPSRVEDVHGLATGQAQAFREFDRHSIGIADQVYKQTITCLLSRMNLSRRFPEHL
ncbi:hypothetical protein [Nocardia jiangxiensis]|uniref:hypothetical protein n=1 Tax=Nocardia jiangxiensis TaxID=282685 RepID=UPI0002F8C7EF|nr:hypothetical protein [Nocardia jiangxiensis]